MVSISGGRGSGRGGGVRDGFRGDAALEVVLVVRAAAGIGDAGEMADAVLPLVVGDGDGLAIGKGDLRWTVEGVVLGLGGLAFGVGMGEDVAGGIIGMVAGV